MGVRSPSELWGPDFVVVASPGRDLGLGVVEIDEPVLIEALVAQLAVEALHVAVLDGLPRANEVDLHARGVDPGIGGSTVRKPTTIRLGLLRRTARPSAR